MFVFVNQLVENRDDFFNLFGLIIMRRDRRGTGVPKPYLANSILYTLQSEGLEGNILLDKNLFGMFSLLKKEVRASKNVLKLGC